MTTDARQALADRIRPLLEGEGRVREVRMFGGIVFMVRDRIVAGADRDGSLLVRVSADRHEELVSRPGASRAEKGPGRPMSAAWVSVTADAVASDGELRHWIDIALALDRAGD